MDGESVVPTHVHGCVIWEEKSSLRSPCLGSVPDGGEGVLMPGCGLLAFACGGDAGEGESNMGTCSFDFVLMADIGEFMLQQRNVSRVLRKGFLQW